MESMAKARHFVWTSFAGIVLGLILVAWMGAGSGGQF